MMQLTSVPAAARSQGHGTNSCSFAPCSQQVARHMAARNAASDATSRSTGLQKCRAAVRCCHWNQSEAGGQRPLSAKPQRPHRRRRPGGAAQPQALDMQKRELIIGRDAACWQSFLWHLLLPNSLARAVANTSGRRNQRCDPLQDPTPTTHDLTAFRLTGDITCLLCFCFYKQVGP